MSDGERATADHPTATAAAPSPVTEPAPARRRRRRWPLWIALVTALMLSVGLPTTLPAGAARDATMAAGVVARAENPTTRAARQLADRITVQLDRQSAALLGGDRAGFLAIAEPAVHADLRRRFSALRALRVTGWEARPSGLPTQAGRAGEWRLTVEFRYCFVVPGCRTSRVLVETRWREGAEPRLLALSGSRAEAQLAGRGTMQAGVLPWEASELVVAVGKRTIVATTPALRKRLPYLLTRAEAAAKVADRYVVVGSPPDRYRIYYAGPKEWKRWYGGNQPEWGAGYAIGIGGGHHEVVLKADAYTAAGLDELLRHELAHAASLPEHNYLDESTWWLTEGLAEYAAADGRAVGRYEGLAAARRLVSRGWDGKLDSLAPTEDAPARRVAGNYGIAYLAVRHLVDRFGEERVLAFVKAVLHDRRIPRQTAEEILGQPWSTIHDECVADIRAVAD